MSKYSPTVLPDYGPSPLTHLADAIGTYVAVKRQRKLDAEREEDRRMAMEDREEARKMREIELARSGYRTGPQPNEPTVFLPDIGAPGTALAGELGVPPVRQRETVSPMADDAFARDLAANLRGTAPIRTAEESPLQQPVTLGPGARRAAAEDQLNPTSEMTPGAFNMGTRRFGAPAPAPAPAPGRTMRISTQDRYLPVEGGGHIDQWATPESRAWERQVAGAQLAAELRQQEEAAEREREVGAYIDMGMTRAQARATRANRGLADNILFPTRRADPYGGRTREQWLQDMRDVERIRDEGNASAQTRQDLSTLNTQVDDARAEVARAERAIPERRQYGFVHPTTGEFYEPGSESAKRFSADSLSSAQRIDALRRYMGDLLAKRDSTAAAARGERPDSQHTGTVRRLYGAGDASPTESRQVITADQAEYLRSVKRMSDAEISARYIIR